MTVPEIWHASAVAVGDRALVCLGKSGSGKSSICLEMMALGATLVGDDRIEIRHGDEAPIVGPVSQIAGRIEARGLGILKADYMPAARVSYILDLDLSPAPRLPELEFRDVLGHAIPLLRPLQSPHPWFALYQLLKSGRAEP